MNEWGQEWTLTDLSFEWAETGVVVRIVAGGELLAAICSDGTWRVTGTLGAMDSEDFVKWLEERGVGVDDVTFLTPEGWSGDEWSSS